MGVVFFNGGSEDLFLLPNISFRRLLNILSTFKSDRNSGFLEFFGCGFSLPGYWNCCAEETENSSLQGWLKSSVFLWKFVFSLWEVHFVLFRPTWGHIFWFLVVFLSMNCQVWISKRVHTKPQPSGTSSSWFTTCLIEVRFSLQLMLFFGLISFRTRPLTAFYPFLPCGESIIQANELIGGNMAGLTFNGGSEEVFHSKKVSFRRSLNVLNCFKFKVNCGSLGFLVVASLYQTMKNRWAKKWF